ncbi:MAG TPA: SusC/RagA family TonB-linked outer membrane protein, partial [Longimicrobiaceae bacterium]|nr:SusC/RagA family TonB-linked outer membrane protein [Longimicrobiaceae bacterium]
MKQISGLLALLLAVAILPSRGVAQATGTVSGQVVDQRTGQPIAGAQVSIYGTTRGEVADQDGRFRIANVPAGQQEIRASHLGYSEARQTVTVGAGETQSVTLTLSPSAVQLGALVVTATGESRTKREVGNSVGIVEPDSVALAAVNNFSQLIQGRAAGVTVLQSSGTTGAAARIRIRGSNSLSLSNEPLLVVDGIRVDNSSTSSIGVGGQNPSRLNDIDPEDIASIEILKGPAASALYGTAAANGVIQITTKRGLAGDTHWTAFTEQGSLSDQNDYPANFTNESGCPLYLAALGGCTADANLISFSPLEDPRTQPFRTGYHGRYGVSVSGGSERATYYLSGDYTREEGIYAISNQKQVNLRANVHAQLRDNWDASLKTGYITSNLQLPQNDNNLFGIISNGLLGDPEFNEATGGYEPVGPNEIFNIDTHQAVRHLIGSVSSNWKPLPWLSIIGTAGLDQIGRHDNETLPAEGLHFGDLVEGYRTSNRFDISTYTTTLNGTATYQITPSLSASTALGTQYNEDIFRGTYAFGQGLLAGTGSLHGTVKLFSVDESNQHTRTFGVFGQQRFSWRDKVFLAGTLRGDKNSAFGQDFGITYYPSASLSWVIGDEPWFPNTNGIVNSLRLRTAYGKAGLSPNFRDALLFLTPTAVVVDNVESPGFTLGGAGNPNLRPEKSAEYELGFDAGLFRDRLGLEFTYYNKTSRDELVARRLAPSLGLSTTRVENLGEVRNSGEELLANLMVVNTRPVKWNATLSYAHNSNKIIELGEGITPIIFGLGGSTQRHEAGYPLGAYFQVPYTFNDANGDGLIGPAEVTMGDSAVFLGTPFPPNTGSVSSDLTFFDIFRISALVGWQSGNKLFNSTHEFRCLFGICRDFYDPSTSPAEQAAFIADAFYGSA